MSNKGESRTKAFEFMTLFMMVLGTVIGSGIYMKNNELLQQTNNPIIGIILWVVVGVVCVLSVVVFMEISSSTKHFGNGTIGNWTKLFIGRKIASLFSLTYVIMYIPSCYAVFTGAFITFLFQAIGMEVSGSVQLTIYLICGIGMLAIFTTINTLKPIIGDKIQFFGTIFKFIPLTIALVAGFFMIDKNLQGTSAMWNEGYAGHEWSTSSWDPSLFLRGFGAILFSFDGYIYIANAQKGAKHKEVVPKALFFGMVFVTIFYTLIAISLFLGSPDGSIVTLFEKMLSGGKDPKDASHGIQLASRVISNTLLMIICLLNVNVFTIIGVVSIESDIDAKILYNRGKTSVNRTKAGFIQFGIAAIFYAIFILLGFMISRNGWHGINTTIEQIKNDSTLNIRGDNDALLFYLNKPAEYLGIISSADSALAFLMIDVLIFAALINRHTKKVDVERKKGMVTTGIISGVLMLVFVIFGIYAFIDVDPTHQEKWTSTTGPWFVALFIGSAILTFILFLIQEHLFKKNPYPTGFDGELSTEELENRAIAQSRIERILLDGKYADVSIKKQDPFLKDKVKQLKDKEIK